MEIRNIIKSVTPSVAVMVVGLLGAWLVYDSFFSDKISATTEQVSIVEPAAGEAETMAAPAADAMATPVAAPAVVGVAAVVEEIKCTMDGCACGDRRSVFERGREQQGSRQ